MRNQDSGAERDGAKAVASVQNRSVGAPGEPVMDGVCRLSRGKPLVGDLVGLVTSES